MLRIKNYYYEPKKESRFEFFDFLTGLAVTSVTMSIVMFGMITSEEMIRTSHATGSSMQPTFDTEVELYYNQSPTVIDSLTYHDIVAFDSGQFDTYIKRVIGLPGDTVEFIDQKLYVNGEYVEEDFIIPDNSKARLRAELGEDEYYLLGDNRPNSTDSRHVLIGAVKKSAIKGRIIGGKSLLSDKTYNFLRIY